MPGPFPDAQTRNPLILPDGQPHPGTVFLKPAMTHPRIAVGEYSYASSATPPDDWAERLAPYLYPQSPEALQIGKFCQIADGVLFITASANHRYDGFSTYPFAIFDGGFSENRLSLPEPGADTVIGHDVWIGHEARILPGVQIGNGAIIGACSVVAADVPPYTIVAGNPARPVRQRFDAESTGRLQAIGWWDWPIDLILRHEAAICGADLSRLEAAACAVRDQAICSK